MTNFYLWTLARDSETEEIVGPFKSTVSATDYYLKRRRRGFRGQHKVMTEDQAKKTWIWIKLQPPL